MTQSNTPLWVLAFLLLILVAFWEWPQEAGFDSGVGSTTPQYILFAIMLAVTGLFFWGLRRARAVFRWELVLPALLYVGVYHVFEWTVLHVVGEFARTGFTYVDFGIAHYPVSVLVLGWWVLHVGFATWTTLLIVDALQHTPSRIMSRLFRVPRHMPAVAVVMVLGTLASYLPYLLVDVVYGVDVTPQSVGFVLLQFTWSMLTLPLLLVIVREEIPFLRRVPLGLAIAIGHWRSWLVPALVLFLFQGAVIWGGLFSIEIDWFRRGAYVDDQIYVTPTWLGGYKFDSAWPSALERATGSWPLRSLWQGTGVMALACMVLLKVHVGLSMRTLPSEEPEIVKTFE